MKGAKKSTSSPLILLMAKYDNVEKANVLNKHLCAYCLKSSTRKDKFVKILNLNKCECFGQNNRLNGRHGS